MQVNYLMLAYILGITNDEAKLMMMPILFKSQKERDKVVLSDIKISMYIDSAKLNLRTSIFGKDEDKIECIANDINKHLSAMHKKEICDYMPNIKKGKLTGKYRALSFILEKNKWTNSTGF